MWGETRKLNLRMKSPQLVEGIRSCQREFERLDGNVDRELTVTAKWDSIEQVEAEEDMEMRVYTSINGHGL